MPNIVTNPPYNSAEGFAAIGTKLADQSSHYCYASLSYKACKACKYNLFSHSAFAGLGVQRAHHLLYEGRTSEREQELLAYAWFVWDRDCANCGPS